MTLFLLAVFFTLGVSALCSVLESMILSVNALDVEEIGRRHAKVAKLIEQMRHELDSTISSILTLNTVANTLGAILIGGLATELFGDIWLGVISGGMTVAILIFSEILPKNVGVSYRRQLFPTLIYALVGIRKIAMPLTTVSTWVVRLVIKPPKTGVSEKEITLLAERGAREGTLAGGELQLIQSSLSLKDARISEIMTPRKVVTRVSSDDTTGEVLGRFRTIPFARLPVFCDTDENIIGIVRRRDILQAVAEGRRQERMDQMHRSALFVPEVGTVAKALEQLIENHQQLAIVSDEFGGFAGVVTLEDIFEYLIGREFYEPDDRAVDMRALAFSKAAARLNGED